MTAKRAVIYTRISLDTTGQGLGVARQEEACRSLAAARGWEVVAVESDNSISASTGKTRPAWSNVLGMIEKQKVDVVVAWAVDRLTRSLVDLEHLILLAEQTGVAIATVSGDLDLTTDTGRMVARILGAVARGEVERKGARQVAYNQQKAKQGRPHWSHRPFGYQMGGVLDPVEAPLLAEAYEDILRGVRLATICKRWTEQGVTTTEGSKWVVQSLGRLMRAPRNAGLRTYNGKVIGAAGWEAIVSEDKWRAAVARMGKPERRGATYAPTDALLVGVAKCGECGKGIHTKKRRHKEDPNGDHSRAYTCPEAHVGLPTDWVEGRLMIELEKILSDPKHIEHWTDRTSEDDDSAAVLRADRDVLKERLRTLGEDYAAGLIDRDTVLAATERLRAQIEEMDAELERLEQSAGKPGAFDLEWFVEHLFTMDRDEARNLLRSVCTVTLYRRGKGVRELRADLVSVDDVTRKERVTVV